MWTFVKYILLLVLAKFAVYGIEGTLYDPFVYLFAILPALLAFVAYTGLSLFLIDKIADSGRPEYAFANTIRSINSGFIEGIFEVVIVFVLPFFAPEWHSIQLWMLFLLFHNVYDAVKANLIFFRSRRKIISS